jgi:hypothetical protein
VVQQAPPTLVVQVVTDTWLPLAGVTVEVRETGPHTQRHPPLASATSDQQGLTCFTVPDAQTYILTLRGGGVIDKEKKMKVRLIRHTKNHPTAYVQVRIEIKVRMILVS